MLPGQMAGSNASVNSPNYRSIARARPKKKMNLPKEINIDVAIKRLDVNSN